MFYSNKYPKSVFRELQDFPYSKRNSRALFNSAKGSEDFVQRLKLLKKLPIHNGCVNCICWNEKGNKILSGSDDQHLIITDPFTYKIVAQYRTNHRANIFSAKFLPNTGDSGIVSCCGDGSILYTDLSRVEETHDCLFHCHAGTTYDVVTIPNDPNVFLSCGEDYTVRSFDLRVKNKCGKIKCKEDVIIQCRRAVTALTVNSLMPCQIAIGCADSTARIYDRRMVDGINARLNPVDAFIKPGLEKKPYRITSLNFSPEGEDLLVSYSSEHVYLFGLKNSKDTVYSTESICGSDEEDGDKGVWCGIDKGDTVPVRRLRLRGDWSDTGPDARPHSNAPASASQGVRRVVQGGLIQRMTDVLSRMLNDPATRAALSQGGESEASDQMQIEEGLGEYLDINGRRRPNEVNAAEPVSNNEAVAATEPVSADDLAMASGEATTQSEDPCLILTNTQDIPTSDESGSSWNGTHGTSVETSSSASTQHLEEQCIPDSAANVVTQVELDEGQQAESTTMDTDELPGQIMSACLPQPISCESLKTKREAASSQSSDPTDRHDHDDEISPVKRAKDERTSPFEERPQPESTVEETEHEVPQPQQPAEPGSNNSDDKSPEDSTSTDEPTVSAPDLQSVPSTSQPTQDEEMVFPSTSRNPNLTDLTDELSTMFNGFKQKYGKKPMVNLVYSVRGSTASTISMTVEDQMNAAPNTSVNQDPPEVPAEDEPVNESVEVAEDIVSPSEEVQEEPSPSLPLSPPCEPLPSSSYSSSRMDNELTRAIRNARRENNQDETVRLKKANIRMKYTGHRNARTMIKEATFWGSDYVMSGSDCGHVFIWTRDTGRLVMTLQADNHVVNCLQPHPTLPILATSGIDYDLKLWAPLAPEPSFDYLAAQELMNRNAIMLEETKDTITVPASFMIRMLACLNQLRRGGPRAMRPRQVPHE